MAIQILTDSAADLPQTIVEEYGIDVAPLHIYGDEQEYLDGKDLQSLQMFNEMRQGKVFKTSQVDPATFLAFFKQYAERGDSCIYVGFSSELSATYQSAVLAKNEIQAVYPDFTVETVDTKCASLGQGLAVLKAAQLVREGKSIPEILAGVEYYASHMEHIFTVEDLEYLYRGGRVSRAAAVVGGILHVKPLLEVNEGKLVPLEKIRGRNKVIRRMIELMGERGVELAKQTIAISHGDDLESATKLQELIKETYGCTDFIINTIGCVIGAHVGPGTLALFFLNDKP
ncbi:MAG: DegV family protein [Dethiobacteraceae bacterium]|jgi:DegV family protein with EDD domain|nr:DegV family protein [Bacillota bacterium]